MNLRIATCALASILVVGAAYADDTEDFAILERSGATLYRDEAQKEKPVVHVLINLRQLTADVNRALSEIQDLPSIEFVGAGDSEITVETMRALQGKKSLKRLAISNAKISDNSAKILGTLKGLDFLDFWSQIEMSPRGREEIFHLTNLKELTLSDRLVSDAVVEKLANLRALKVLTIRSVFLTDIGVASIAQLKDLRSLRILLGPNVTDLGLNQLVELQLPELEITYMNVTNANLKELRKFSGLKALRFINGVKVTDEAIPFISELNELKELDLSDAMLTKAGIKELRKALPNCKVVHDARKRD